MENLNEIKTKVKRCRSKKNNIESESKPIKKSRSKKSKTTNLIEDVTKLYEDSKSRSILEVLKDTEAIAEDVCRIAMEINEETPSGNDHTDLELFKLDNEF